ncbi:MAG: hypothetical protein Q7S33_04125 [Nanoarchaeota archaeon]|nr:hypothetical protein [Nanoarchaeota archaeon]
MDSYEIFEKERASNKDNDLIVSRLKFDNIKPGFYLENKSAIYTGGPLPFWSEVVYIENSYTKGQNLLYGNIQKVIMGREFSNCFLISEDEAQSFYKIKNTKLARLLIDEDTPINFVEWFLRVSENGVKDNEMRSPEYKKWLGREVEKLRLQTK